jgi:hypothetical protein
MQGLIMKTALAPAGDPTLTAKLPEAKPRALCQAAITDLGIRADGAGSFRAVVRRDDAQPRRPPQKLGYDPNSGAERTLTEAAKAANKQLVGLETAEQQLGYLRRPARRAAPDQVPGLARSMIMPMPGRRSTR